MSYHHSNKRPLADRARAAKPSRSDAVSRSQLQHEVELLGALLHELLPRGASA